MGVLGTMVVNFTANVQGLQSGVRNAEETSEDHTQSMQAIAGAAIASGIVASNIAKMSDGILGMSRHRPFSELTKHFSPERKAIIEAETNKLREGSNRRKRQSTRRMRVAQKRLKIGKDILRR